MKRMIKTIYMPDGRTVILRAAFAVNMQEVAPEVEGPFDDLMSLLGHTFRGVIDGVGFNGWMHIALKEHGCRYENHEEGEWKVFVE